MHGNISSTERKFPIFSHLQKTKARRELKLFTLISICFFSPVFSRYFLQHVIDMASLRQSTACTVFSTYIYHNFVSSIFPLAPFEHCLLSVFCQSSAFIFFVSLCFLLFSLYFFFNLQETCQMPNRTKVKRKTNSIRKEWLRRL